MVAEDKFIAKRRVCSVVGRFYRCYDMRREEAFAVIVMEFYDIVVDEYE